MTISYINWLAVLVAGISAFVVGGIWYSPGLFGNVWMKENKIGQEDIRRSDKGRIFGSALILALVMSTNLALFLSDAKTDLRWGFIAGLLTGVWVFCGLAITAMFELRTCRYVFINGGYQLVALALMGAIIGVWR